MKKLLLLTFALSLFACDGGGDGDNNINNDLVGKWSLNQIDEGFGLVSFDEFFVWELNSNGSGVYRYMEDGTPPEVTFDIIWEVTANNVLRFSADGGQDWEEETILLLTNSELWTYSDEWEEECRYIKIP